MPGQERTWLDSMAQAYERWLVPSVFAPFAADLARRATSSGAARILEVAAGSGVLTRLLPPAGATATDLNPPMVRIGRRMAPQAAWAVADATRLPFGDGAFQLVLCQFGAMFFPDKPAAFAEIRRVSGVEGRFLFNVWDSIDEHDFARALQSAMERLFSADVPDFIAAIPHGYADPSRIERDLAAGGMGVESFETIELTGKAASAAELATGFAAGTPLGRQLAARAELPDAMDRLRAEMIRQLGPGPISGRMRAHVIQARPQLR